MEKVKSKILIMVAVFICVITVFMKCSFAEGKTNFTGSKEGDLANFAKNNLNDFLNQDINYLKAYKNLFIGGNCIHYTSATCMYHTQSSIRSAPLRIAGVIDVEGDNLTVDGKQVSLNATQKKYVADLSYAIYNSYTAGVEGETTQKKALRYIFSTYIRSLLPDSCLIFFTNKSNPGTAQAGTKTMSEYSYTSAEKGETKQEPQIKKRDGKMYVGPFKAVFSGYKMDDLTVKVDGKQISVTDYYTVKNDKFIRNSGTNIPSKTAFYIKLPDDTSKNSSWSVVLKSSGGGEKYKGRIVLLYNPGNGGQNIAIYGGKKKESNEEIKWSGEGDPVEKDDGELEIIKSDAFSQRLSGAIFIIRDITVNGDKSYIIADKNGDGTYEFSKYGLSGQKTKLVTNSNGVIKVTGLQKNHQYRIAELKAPDGYERNSSYVKVVTLSSSLEKVAFHNSKEKQEPSSLKIIKVDKNTGEPIEGVKFKISLTYSGTEKYKEFVGWKPNDDAEDEQHKPLTPKYEDATKDYETSKTYDDVSTNENGTIVQKISYDFGENITIDKIYCTVEEIWAPSPYNIDAQNPSDLKQTTTISPGESATFKFENKAYGKLKIVKKNQHGSRVANVGFNIACIDDDGTKYITDFDDDDNKVTFGGGTPYTFMTDSNGILEVDGLPITSIEGSTYFIKEVDAPSGYIVDYQPEDETEKIVDVSMNTQIDILNIETGTARIRKIGDNNETLNDVEFVLSAPNGQYLRINDLDYANGTIKIDKYEDIEYVDSREEATVFVTNGTTVIENIPTGTYSFEELHNSNYGYKNNADKIFKITVSQGDNEINVQNEQVLGNLEIHKVDKRALDWWGTEVNLAGVEFKVRLTEISAGEDNGNIYKYIKLVGSNGQKINKINGSATISKLNKASNGEYHVDYVDTESDATIFVTDSNGRIVINNLEVYKAKDEKYTYYIDEYAMGEEYSPYYDVKTKSESLKDNDYLQLEKNVGGKNSTKLVQNNQMYVDLSGYVWDDGHDGKSTVRDNEYIEGTSDRRVAKDDLGSGKYKGITVYLLKDNNVIAKAETDNNGAYFFPSQMSGTTSKYPEIKEVKSGGYKIVIEEISSYSIEFYYNGLKYASVDLPNNLQEYWNKAGSSKASDNSDSRNDINQRFSSVQGNAKRNNNGTTGIADGKEKENNVNLRYTNGEHTSTLVGNTKYTGESLGLQNSVNPTNSATVMASTTDANYTIKFIPEMNRVRKTIENLNLGIYEKEQPDLAITTDLNNIKMTINGYSHTYNYQKRGDINYPKIEGDAGYDAALDVFSVKARQLYVDGYKNLSYVREIFPSYLAYTDIIDENDENRLRVFVTYKIVVKNESSSLTNTFRLRNYCDSNYELYAVNNDTNAVNQWRENGQQGGAKVYETNGYLELGQENCLEIYLTYEMSRGSLVNLMTNELQTKTNTTEIFAYTTSKENAPYAGIDKDSAPDNSIYGSVDTYEDDIDSAPDLVIRKSKNQKTISGMVFEDKIVTSGTTSKDNTGEYIGNGQYENGENGVETVQVRLVDKDGNDVTLYKINNSGRGEKLGNYMITENNGEYKFEGLVPGIYYLEYTYGRYDEHGNVQQEKKITKIDGTEVTTQDYKSTIVGNQNVKDLIKEYYANGDIWSYAEEDVIKKIGSKEGYWYEGLNNESVAVDDYQHRLAINNELADIYYKKKTAYDNRDEFEDVPNIYLMTARTPVMSIAIEDMDTNTSNTGNNTSGVDGNYDASGNVLPNEYNIKFGIVERPRQNFEVTKVVSYAKVILANGQVLIEGNPSDNEQLAKMNYTTYPENGKLKIEIDNEIIEGATLELKYDIVVTNLSDENYNTFRYYSFAEDKNNIVTTKIQLIDYLDNELSLVSDEFSRRNASELEQNGLISPSTAKNNNYNFIVDVDDNYIMVLEPGGSKTINIGASKLLSTAKDMTYDNIVEFLKVHNDVGRFYKGTPGNENFGDENGNNPGTPTNPNPSEEPDNNRNRPPAIVTIVPPTGQTRIYYAIGISCFLVLLVGIILIKKKVVDK